MRRNTATGAQWRAIASLYDAALDTSPDRWITALSHISDAIGAGDSVVLAVQRGSIEFTNFVRFRVDDATASDFESYFAARDPVLGPAIPTAQPGDLLVSTDLITNAALERTEFFTDFLRPLRMYQGAAVVLARHDSVHAVAHFTRASGARSYTAGPGSPLSNLIPHLQRAVQLSIRLSATARAHHHAHSMLERAHEPVLVVDAQARVVFANTAAERLLATEDGLAVEQSHARCGGRLRAVESRGTAALRHLIANASRTAVLTMSTNDSAEALVADDASGGMLLLQRPSGKPALIALVAPHRPAEDDHNSSFSLFMSAAHRGTAIVSIVDPSNATGSEKLERLLTRVLCSRFVLTPAEARVAIEIANGDGLSSVAMTRRVSLATVRAQAQRIYDKVGVRGQTALARLVTQLRERIRQATPFE